MFLSAANKSIGGSWELIKPRCESHTMRLNVVVAVVVPVGFYMQCRCLSCETPGSGGGFGLDMTSAPRDKDNLLVSG